MLAPAQRPVLEERVLAVLAPVADGGEQLARRWPGVPQVHQHRLAQPRAQPRQRRQRRARRADVLAVGHAVVVRVDMGDGARVAGGVLQLLGHRVGAEVHQPAAGKAVARDLGRAGDVEDEVGCGQPAVGVGRGRAEPGTVAPTAPVRPALAQAEARRHAGEVGQGVGRVVDAAAALDVVRPGRGGLDVAHVVAQAQQPGGDLQVHPGHAGEGVGTHRAEHGDAQSRVALHGALPSVCDTLPEGGSAAALSGAACSASSAGPWPMPRLAISGGESSMRVGRRRPSSTA